MSLLVGLSFSPPTPLLPLHAIIARPLDFPFSISPTLTLPMAKDGNCNIGGHGNNNTRNNASKTLDEQIEKQHYTHRTLQVGYSEHKQQPLSAMSHTHREGPKPPLTRSATTKLPWELYTIPSHAGPC
jgi:hypothetical protein